MKDTLAVLRTLFITKLKLKMSPGDITEDTQIFGADGLGLDSIDILELIVGIKKEFGIDISDRKVAEKVFITVGSVIQYIESNT
ncbi:MAG: phosphopantetheine-binding protein [Nitrospira bacterium SG8_35_4]|nr:MAG: phosphopantetheine-binding protein [Nitrospira bacterium SG8_35_4]